MVRHGILLYVALSMALPVTAKAQEASTLEETLRYVYHENPTLVTARYALRATQEQLPQAQAGWQPKVSAETNITSTNIESGNFNEGDGATTKGASVSVEQPLFRGFRTLAESTAARNRIKAGIERVKEAEQDIFVQTVESYTSVIRDRMLLELQKKNKDLLARERESVSARFEAGDITQTDVKQTEAKYSKAVADEAIAESKVNASEAVFEKVTGLTPSPAMEMPAAAFEFPTNIDELIKMAALQNPELSRRRSEHQAAESDIRAVRSDFYPQVSAFANHVKEYDPQPGIVDESESSTIGLRARISLYEGGNTLSRVREAKSRASQRFSEIRESEVSVKSEIMTFWKQLQAYEVEIAARELEVMAAKFSSEGVREEARLGERTVLDTLDADQDVLDAESALVGARRDKIVIAYRLAAALGLLLPERLGFGGEERFVTSE